MSAFNREFPAPHSHCPDKLRLNCGRERHHPVTFSKANPEEQKTYSSRDLVKIYLKDIGRIPLLRKDEEVALARRIQQHQNLLKIREKSHSDPIIANFVRAIAVRDRLAAQTHRRPSTQRWARELNLTGAELQQIVERGKERWALIAGVDVRELEEIQKTGMEAKNKMIGANLRLVVSIAKKYQNRGLELLDLIQEGTLGLERAVEKFDGTKGYRFSTYSYWWIRQGITRAIATQSRTIRIPVHITEKLNQIKKAQRQLSQVLGRTASLEEVARQVNLSAPELREFLSRIPRSISLEIRVGNELDTELVELIETNLATPEENLMRDSIQEQIAQLMNELNERERKIISLRYGLENGTSYSLSDTADIMQISRERVRQIQTKALQKLRQPEQRQQVQDYLDALSRWC